LHNLTSEVSDELQAGLKVRGVLADMCGDKVLQVGVDAGLKNRQEGITNCIDLAGFASKLRQGWYGGTVRFGNNSRLVFGDLESIFIKCLRNVLLPSVKSALVSTSREANLTSNEKGSRQ
jgi:hypothetical protein